MANTNTDLTEEDAADLQFPKEDLQSHTSPAIFSSSFSSSNNETTNYCANCFSELVSQYILCEKCKVNICLLCFSNGAEFNNHKNDHDYRILTTTFLLFENSGWTAEEEVKLLDSIIAYGNWNLVASEFPNRTADEIKEHYEYFYLEKNGHVNMPTAREQPSAVSPQPLIPYRFRLTDSEDPPRYASNTIGYQSLAGYNPARSDFESEFDKGAEDILSTIESVDPSNPHYETITNLQCCIVQSYNRRLKERQRWKKIISQHGLLILRKTISWLRRYDMTITRHVYEKMIRFMQFCRPTKFEMLMEGLHRAGELQHKIQRLIELRKKGITTLAEGRLYLALQQIHDKNKKELKMFRSNGQFKWKMNRNTNFDLIPKLSRRRTTFAPIEIVGMPGFEKLTEKEKDLCSTIRLVPITYLELKEILVAENSKMGHVKLQTARRLLKIDVNKTRRLFDFLVTEGYITKPVF